MAADTDAADTEQAEAADPADTDAEPAPASPAYEELAARIDELLGDEVIEAAHNHHDYVVRVKADAWRHAAEVAHEHLDCDYLSFVSGVDWAPTPREGGDAPSAPVQPQEMTPGVAGGTGRFQAFAHVESTSRNWGVTFKTDVAEDDPRVQSWVGVYAGADWHERECWEMYGFVFDDHPSLRPLYLPAEFEGHPLRKDFPLTARSVKPWPGLVDVEAMPEDEEEESGGNDAGGNDSGGDA